MDWTVVLMAAAGGFVAGLVAVGVMIAVTVLADRRRNRPH